MSGCDHQRNDGALTRRALLAAAGGLSLAALSGAVDVARGGLASTFTRHHPGRVPPAARYIVMLVIDAARADYLHSAHLPHIAALRARGSTFPNAWVGQMESVTPASHATIGTGMFPRRDGGILGFWYEDAETRANYTCAPLDASDPGRIERIIAAAGVPTLSGMIKAQDPGARIFTSSGQKFYAADAVGGPGADYISYFAVSDTNAWVPRSISGHDIPNNILGDPNLRYANYKTMQLGQQDYLAGQLASAMVQQERPRFVMLNLAEMDWPVAHINGGPLDPHAVDTLMTTADSVVGLLVETYRSLGLLDQTVFVLTSDHGTVPTTRLVNRTSILDNVQRAGTQIVTADFHTAGLLWLEDSFRAQRAAALIDEARIPGVTATYYSSPQPDGSAVFLPAPNTLRTIPPTLDAAYRYLLDTINGPTTPHVVCVYGEHTGTADAGGSVAWKGDHGGFSWESHAIPLVIAGPGVRRRYVSPFPARTVDITPTVLRLLGAPYPRLDGVALADAFTRPLGAELQMQRGVGRFLTPYAATLQEQSARDVAAQ